MFRYKAQCMQRCKKGVLYAYFLQPRALSPFFGTLTLRFESLPGLTFYKLSLRAFKKTTKTTKIHGISDKIQIEYWIMQERREGGGGGNEKSVLRGEVFIYIWEKAKKFK